MPRPENLAIADWSYRPSHAVQSWARRLDEQLRSLLGRERARLGPLSLRESDELLAYWSGQLPEAPALSVAFSGLGPTAGGWVREVGELSRLIRSAAIAGQGLTSLVTREGGQVSGRGAGGCSREMVTGPSLTSATCMSAAKTPSSTRTPEGAERLARLPVEPARLVGRGGVHEARAAALAGVGVERELAHHERRAVGVEEREVHLSRGVLEDAQPGDAVGERHRLGVAVALADPEEDQEARADGADRAALDRDRGLADALEEGLHARPTLAQDRRIGRTVVSATLGPPRIVALAPVPRRAPPTAGTTPRC